MIVIVLKYRKNHSNKILVRITGQILQSYSKVYNFREILNNICYNLSLNVKIKEQFYIG